MSHLCSVCFKSASAPCPQIVALLHDLTTRCGITYVLSTNFHVVDLQEALAASRKLIEQELAEEEDD